MSDRRGIPATPPRWPLRAGIAVMAAASAACWAPIWFLARAPGAAPALLALAALAIGLWFAISAIVLWRLDCRMRQLAAAYRARRRPW